MRFTKSNTSTDLLVGGAVSLTLATILVKLLGLIYKIPLSYILGDSGMGLFNSAYTVYSLFYIVAVSGVPKAITILIAEYNARGKYADGRKIYVVAKRVFVTIGIMLSIILLILSKQLAQLIGNEKSAYSIALIAPSIVFICLSGVIRGGLCAHSNFKSIAMSQVVDAFARVVLGIVFAVVANRLNMSDEMISAFTIFGATVGSFFSCLYLIFSSKTQKLLENTEQYGNSDLTTIKSLGKILRISIPLTLGAIVMNIAGVIDLTLIMRRLVYAGYTNYQANSLYGNYSTMVTPMLNLVASLISPITMTVIPSLTAAYTNRNYVEVNKHITFAIRISSFVGMPLTFGLIFFSKESLSLIFDDAGAITASPMLSLAATAIIFISLSTVINSCLEAFGLVKAPIYSTLIAAIVKIGVSFLLIGDSSFGISGAAISTVVFYVLSTAIGALIIIIKCNVELGLLRNVCVPFMASISMILLTNLVGGLVPDQLNNDLKSLFKIIMCAFFYLVNIVLFSFILKKRYKFSSKCTKNYANNY